MTGKTTFAHWNRDHAITAAALDAVASQPDQLHGRAGMWVKGLTPEVRTVQGRSAHMQTEVGIY